MGSRKGRWFYFLPLYLQLFSKKSKPNFCFLFSSFKGSSFRSPFPQTHPFQNRLQMRKTSAQGLATLFSLVIVNLFENITIRIALLSVLAITIIIHSRVVPSDTKVEEEVKKEVVRRRSSAAENLKRA